MGITFKFQDEYISDIVRNNTPEITAIASSTNDPNKIHNADFMSNVTSRNKTYELTPVVLGTEMEFGAVNFLRSKLPPFVSLENLQTDFKNFLFAGDDFYVYAWFDHVITDGPKEDVHKVAYQVRLLRPNININDPEIKEKVRNDELEDTDLGFILKSKMNFRLPFGSTHLRSLYDKNAAVQYPLTDQDLINFSNNITYKNPDQEGIMRDPEGYILASCSGIIAEAAKQGRGGLEFITDENNFPVFDSHNISTSPRMELFRYDGYLSQRNNIFSNIHTEQKDKRTYEVNVIGFIKGHEDQIVPLYAFGSVIKILNKKKFNLEYQKI